MKRIFGYTLKIDLEHLPVAYYKLSGTDLERRTAAFQQEY